MFYPYQCIKFCNLQAGEESQDILAAASGPSLFIFSLLDGSLLYQWSSVDSKPKEPEEVEMSSKPTRSSSASLSDLENQTVQSESARKTKPTNRPKTPPSNITRITTDLDGQYVVISTDLDKCIRVFHASGHDKFALLSERKVPKRSCEIAITPDQTTILCGDKFGDVYSLPLLTNGFDSETAGDQEENADKIDSPSFVPSANEFTVHTARNREALKSQLRTKLDNKRKQSRSTNHKLLLGHVSMLTDVKAVSIPCEKDSTQLEKTYIITADRDEHIRVSRGPPQSHIIETFCQGHAEFISRICIPPWDPSLLFSGGGEDYIFVWDWLNGRLIQKANVRQHLSNSLDTREHSASRNASHTLHPANSVRTQKNEASQRSVSLILGIPDISPLPQPQPNKETKIKQSTQQILVGFEGTPAIFIYCWSLDQGFKHVQTMELFGNALDATCRSNGRLIIVSIDNVHVKGSTNLIDGHADNNNMRLQIFQKEESTGLWADDSGNLTLPANFHGNVLTPEVLEEGHNGKSALSNLLYTYETIRKQDRETLILNT